MSYEGGFGVFEENSGEIQIENNISDRDVIFDNSSGVNNSYIIMGHSTGEEGDSKSVNVFYKQIARVIDEKSVIFNDIKSVEWLKNRSDLGASIDLDLSKSDEWWNYCTTDITNNDDNEHFRVPSTSTLKFNAVEETSVSNVNWEDYVLEPERYTNATTILNNVLLVPTKCESDLEIGIQKVDCFLNAPNTGIQTIFNSELANSSCLKPKEEIQLESSLSTFPLNAITQSNRPNEDILNKLPFVKVSKHCLAKGKILGRRRDIPLHSKKRPSIILEKNNLVPPRPSTNNSDLNKQPSLLKGKEFPNQTHRLNTVNIEGNQTDVTFPVYSKTTQKDSLLKVNHPRSILKINNTSVNHDVTTDTFPKESANISSKDTARDDFPLAIVAISTNKANDTTEITIKTDEGENVYKGKTSDIMKATRSTDIANPTNVAKPTDIYNSEFLLMDKDHDNEKIKNLMVKLLGVTDEVLDSIDSTVLLQCPVDNCNYVSSKGSWLKVHILQHYGIRPFKCDYLDCKWAFYTKFKLKRHQKTHTKKKDFKCPLEGCGRFFSTTSNLKLHFKLHERPKTVPCTVQDCNESFQTRKSLENHLREHGVEYAPYTCQYEGCGKKYFSISTLNSHNRFHQHSEEELKCSYCGKGFQQPCRLKEHIYTHIGVKPYKCDFQGCIWSFSTSSKLRRHQRKHTQVRKHQCQVCCKSFLRSEHLRNHNIKHFVKKTFVCQVADCTTVCHNKSSMYAHLKKHRMQELKNEQETFPCPVENCYLVFTTGDDLRSHLQSAHGPSCGIVSFNSTSQGLLVGMSDLVQCIPTSVGLQEEYSEPNSSNIITHVVFTNDQPEEDRSTVSEPEEQSTPITEVTIESDEQDGIGSARTGLTYQATVEGKHHSTDPPPTPLPAAGLRSVASDVVLSAGLLASQDTLLQDELTVADLYLGVGGAVQEDNGLLGAAGELQVLLLDPSTRLQHSDFEQSTINLRDLE